MSEAPQDTPGSIWTDASRAPAQRLRRRNVKVSRLVASEIVTDIVERGLQPGDQLPTEAEMLEHFDVGRASLREALRLLESYGLILIRQGSNGGPVVGRIEPQEVAQTLSLFFHVTGATYGELIDARLVIEPVMARLAAEQQDPESIAQLRDAVDREHDASFDQPEYVECANAFSYTVSGMSGNRVLDLLGRSLRVLYQDRTASGATLPEGSRPASRRRHEEIGAAIIGGDGAHAEELMREHLRILAEAQFDVTPSVAIERIAWGASDA